MSVTTPEFARTPEIVDIPTARGRDLQKKWESGSGLWGWITTVDHKEIGQRYILTAFALLALGGLEALTMRLQLASPDQHILGPTRYDQLYSMHGVTMIFLYSMPVLSGFSNYLWPLLLGTRDMAFPRVNALSYWIYLASSIFLYVGFFMGAGPNNGWFNLAPYSEKLFNPGMNMDFFALGMIFNGVSTLVGAINFVVTFLRTRCPGMSINRVPVMVWGTATASAANILVVPSVSLAFFFLWMDRNFGTNFFRVSAGGQPVLWQHLFWMFGHPWVYAIVLPAMGMVSDALPVFCRRPLVGYSAVVLSTVATMMLGFGVWVHHMFADGMPNLALAFFSGISFIIAIPSAVAVFSWTATIWLGKPIVNTAFLFFASMIGLFVIGGVSGFMMAAVPVDWQLNDTYFVVGHIHYVLIGINLFPVVGAIYLWFPKMTGRMLDETLGMANFWTMFFGFNLSFLPMHLSGLWGMPRRIYTYPPGMDWSITNMITTIGAFIFAVGVILLIVNVIVSLWHGRIAGPNPWDAPTLEWSVSSPPPPYNFDVIPTVASRHPLWEEKLAEHEARSVVARGAVLDQDRETFGSSVLDGDADTILKMPRDTPVPFLLTIAMSAAFVGLLVHMWWLAYLGTACVVLAIGIWTWPIHRLAQVTEPTVGAEHV